MVKQSFTSIEKNFESGNFVATLGLIDENGKHTAEDVDIKLCFEGEILRNMNLPIEQLSALVELLSVVQSEVSKWENSSAK